MSSDVLVRYIEQRPFEPFTLVMTNGREIHVPHSDFVVVGYAVMSVNVLLPTGQLEVIDSAHVVSIWTFYVSGLPTS